MSFAVIHRDLQLALAVVGLAMSGDSGTSPSFLFRRHPEDPTKIEILAFCCRPVPRENKWSGGLFASAPLRLIAGTPPPAPFSVGGARLVGCLRVIGMGETLTFEQSDDVTLMHVRGGRQVFLNDNVDDFSTWADSTDIETCTGTVRAERLRAALQFLKPFFGDTEGASVAESREGALVAVDRSNACRVEVPGVAECHIRVHKRSLPSLHRFLSICGYETLEVVETQRTGKPWSYSLRRGDGSRLGEYRYYKALRSPSPTAGMPRGRPCEIPAADLRSALKWVGRGLLHVSQDGDQLNIRGGSASDHVSVTSVEQIPDFQIESRVLGRVLDLAEDPILKLAISVNEEATRVRYATKTRCGDPVTIILLRNAGTTDAPGEVASAARPPASASSDSDAELAQAGSTEGPTGDPAPAPVSAVALASVPAPDAPPPPEKVAAHTQAERLPEIPSDRGPGVEAGKPDFALGAVAPPADTVVSDGEEQKAEGKTVDQVPPRASEEENPSASSEVAKPEDAAMHVQLPAKAVKDLGTKHTCFKCLKKFYDLKKPVPVCPVCGADQRGAPARTGPDGSKSVPRLVPAPDERVKRSPRGTALRDSSQLLGERETVNA